jgi:hypothetical protein
MQVINKIIQKVDLPKQFVNSYIINCINNYKGETRKDMKHRLARIIAIFITNLMENGHLTFDNNVIPTELDELCVENRKLEEITKLIQKLNLSSDKRYKWN